MRFLSALLGAVFILPAFGISRLMPMPEWLVPASSLIVIAKASEVRTLHGSQALDGKDSRDAADAEIAVFAQITRIAVRSTILGHAPREPLLVHSTISGGLNPLEEGKDYLLFLAKKEEMPSAYSIVDALRIENGQVYWPVDSTRLGATPLDAVVRELEAFIASQRETR